MNGLVKKVNIFKVTKCSDIKIKFWTGFTVGEGEEAKERGEFSSHTVNKNKNRKVHQVNSKSYV